MIKLSRLSDYAMVIMTHLAKRSGQHNALGVAEATRLPQPTVAKLMKAMARAELLVSQRGARGGYALAKAPEEISVASVIEAVDGPIALTECVDPDLEGCAIQSTCLARANWMVINERVRAAFQSVTLADMASAIPPVFLDPEERPLAPPRDVSPSDASGAV